MANVFSARSIFIPVLSVCILVAACKKNANDIPIAEQSSKPKVKEVKQCRITSIDVLNHLREVVGTARFEYNDKGDPTMITPPFIGTANPVHLFRYDNKERLTDYIGTYAVPTSINDPVGFEFWHRYVYDNKNRVVWDTAFIWGMYGPDPVTLRPDLHYRRTFEYDAQDRIIKETFFSQHVPPAGIPRYFNYDNAGNLIQQGVVYDNTVSLRRSNALWMFIDRNYSVNNEVTVEGYNKYGLPTAFSTDRFHFFLSSLVVRYVHYDCKGDPHNN